MSKKTKFEMPSLAFRLFCFIGAVIFVPLYSIVQIHNIWWHIIDDNMLRQDATACWVFGAVIVVCSYAKWLQKVHRQEAKVKKLPIRSKRHRNRSF